MFDRPIRRLFVYGTLMPGRLRWPFLEPFSAGQCPAAARGQILDSGQGWPVAVLSGPAVDAGNEHDVVPGFAVDLHALRLDEALVILDEVEDVATDTLRRVVVTTTAGEDAWARFVSCTCRYLPPPLAHRSAQPAQLTLPSTTFSTGWCRAAWGWVRPASWRGCTPIPV